MTTMMGANLADLDALQRTFREVADRIAECRQRVDAVLGGTAWTGSAAEQFRALWTGEYAPAFARCAADLTEKAGYVAKRREAIDLATSAL